MHFVKSAQFDSFGKEILIIANAMIRVWKSFILVTGLRISKKSTAFYEALGLEKRRELPIRDEAINYFFGVPGKPQPELELTLNFGVDSYKLGTGYGHVALRVNDLSSTLAKLAKQGIEPEKPPYTVRAGGSLLCFVRDPDGYRIELIESPH